jgi:hypothetical protein
LNLASLGNGVVYALPGAVNLCTHHEQNIGFYISNPICNQKDDRTVH